MRSQVQKLEQRVAVMEQQCEKQTQELLSLLSRASVRLKQQEEVITKARGMVAGLYAGGHIDVDAAQALTTALQGLS